MVEAFFAAFAFRFYCGWGGGLKNGEDGLWSGWKGRGGEVLWDECVLVG